VYAVGSANSSAYLDGLPPRSDDAAADPEALAFLARAESAALAVTATRTKAEIKAARDLVAEAQAALEPVEDAVAPPPDGSRTRTTGRSPDGGHPVVVPGGRQRTESGDDGAPQHHPHRTAER